MKRVIPILSCLFLLFGVSKTSGQLIPVGIPNQYTGLIKHGTAFNGKFLFGAGNELFSTDGTINGTIVLHSFNGQFYYGPYCFRELNNRLYFMAHDSLYGQELWVTDGTITGTSMVKDINPGMNSALTPVNTRSMNPNIIQVLNGKLYFAADDGVSGRELWVSDGTSSGTQMLKDIYPGATGGIPVPPGSTEEFIVAGNKIYFPADDGNGTGFELWATDGTTAGTQLVKDIVPGAMASNPGQIIPYLDKVVFSTGYYTTSMVRSIYISDGTAGGTVEIAGGIQNTYDHAVLNNKLYFGAIDNNSAAYLYETDGTMANTSMLLTLTTETGIVPEDAGRGNICLTAFNNKLYFRNGQSGNGVELWQSDGTIAGTAMLKDMYPGTYSTHPNSFAELNGRLFFRTDDSFVMNIHYTDGTTAGTVQIQSPLPTYYVYSPFARRAFSSFPLVPVGSTLYFTNPYDLSIAVYRLDVPAGIGQQVKVSRIDVYPNPSHGYLNIDTENAVSIVIHDISGRSVYSKDISINEKIHKADVYSLSPGTYTTTTLLKDGTKLSGKFVKQ